jgi:HEPN domain-containing protein
LHDRAFPRTHDLRLLIQLAIVINPSFEHYQEAEELQEAIKKASEIFNFITSLLSDEIRSFLI